MIKIIKHAINKNAWLFLAAAWVYTLSFIFTNYFSYSSSSEKVAAVLSEYIHGQENSFKNVLHDSAAVSAIINDAPSFIKEQLLSDAQGIFAYQVNDLGNPVEIFWNTNKMSPAQEDLSKQDGSYLVSYQNGIFEFVKTSFTKNHANYFFVMLVPIRWQYFMQNEYLQPHFAVNEEIGKGYEIDSAGKGTPVINSSGVTLFSIKEISQAYNDSPVGFSVFLRFLALLCLFLFLNNVARETANQKNFRSGFILLLLSFLLLRLIIYLFPFPFNYHIMPLFDPAVYSGGSVNRSLGDLLLNVLLVLWIIIFFRKKIKVTALHSLQVFPHFYRLLIFSSFLVIPFISFYVADIISGLVIHSAISFNAADFFSLSLFSLAGFIIICILLYIWLYLTGLFVQFLTLTKIALFWQYILVVACSFFLISIHIFSADPKLLLNCTGFIILLITLLFSPTICRKYIPFGFLLMSIVTIAFILLTK